MKILVTGGASGVGSVISTRLCQNPDHTVIATYANSEEKAVQLEEKFSNLQKWKCNFNSAEDIEKTCAMIAESDIDCIVNNAFTGLIKKHFHKLSSEQFDESFKSNILPVIKLTQASINVFRKKKFGKIITILSSAMIGSPPIGWSMYVAEKNYLLGLHRAWTSELKTKNITSNCISPSFMLTNLNKDVDERMIETMKAGHPLKEFLNPEEVAKSVEYIVEAAQHLNGSNIILNAAESVI